LSDDDRNRCIGQKPRSARCRPRTSQRERFAVSGCDARWEGVAERRPVPAVRGALALLDEARRCFWIRPGRPAELHRATHRSDASRPAPNWVWFEARLGSARFPRRTRDRRPNVFRHTWTGGSTDHAIRKAPVFRPVVGCRKYDRIEQPARRFGVRHSLPCHPGGSLQEIRGIVVGSPRWIRTLAREDVRPAPRTVTPRGGAGRRRRNWTRDPHATVWTLDVATQPRRLHLFEMHSQAAVPHGMGCRVGSTGGRRLARRLLVGRPPGQEPN